MHSQHQDRTGWAIDRNARVATYTQTATSDDFVQFTGNFNDDAPCTWVIPRIHQQDGGLTIRMHNANIVFIMDLLDFLEEQVLQL